MPDKQEIPIARYDAMHAVVDGDDLYKLVRSTTEVNDNGRFVLLHRPSRRHLLIGPPTSQEKWNV